ncbi:HAD family acid phosphatase [Pelagibius sp. CAU 1746]|uniref:5'-nucleotidase, lipoprotein e(P4) family n=1 Tax=Pelagibius sp. CAU 1746 TaxID=3140370 RepID=UPI00325ABEC4
MGTSFSERPLGGLCLVLAGCLWAVTAQAQEMAGKPAANDGTNATYWMQNSVEYKANTEALYALARIRLNQAIADQSWTAAMEQGPGYEKKPVAVILDVDETVLDNSLYQAWIVENGQHYSSKTWAPFVHTETSRAIPGSLDFINYAHARGVAVFYVSNRKAPEEAPTRNNLTKLGYPIGDQDDRVLLRGEKEDWGSDKGTRRAVVAENYRIALLIGDNLGDFLDGVDVSPAERQKLFQDNAAHWGRDWIMLPNPSYGSWEGASFGFNWGAPGEEKRQMKFDKMDDWKPAN